MNVCMYVCRDIVMSNYVPAQETVELIQSSNNEG